MTTKMEYYLEEYNVVSSSPMALVMFRYALDHISRCTRVLLQDNGESNLVWRGLLVTGDDRLDFPYVGCKSAYLCFGSFGTQSVHSLR